MKLGTTQRNIMRATSNIMTLQHFFAWWKDPSNIMEFKRLRFVTVLDQSVSRPAQKLSNLRNIFLV